MLSLICKKLAWLQFFEFFAYNCSHFMQNKYKRNQAIQLHNLCEYCDWHVL